MNDEMEQVSRETFDKIVFGVMIVALLCGAGLLLTLGADTLWFIRAVGLFIIALVAYTIHLTGRLKVAPAVLAAGMIIIILEICCNSIPLPGFVPYLLIPVTIFISFFFNPKVTLGLTLAMVVAFVAIVGFTGQFAPASLLSMVPAIGLTLLLALLGMDNKRSLTTLGHRLLQNRQLLKSRALELMQAQTKVDDLQQQLVGLQKQLKIAEKEANQLRSTVSVENDELYNLIQGTVKELNSSIATLEHSIEKIGAPAQSNGSRDFMTKAWEQLYRLRALVVNLDELAHIEHDDFSLDYQVVDVEQLVSEVAGTARGLAREKQLEIRHHATPNLPKVQADPARLRQVLLQLINNAIKYTDEGFVEIRAEIDNRQLVIFVSDTGIGLSSEEAELVFEKFGRASGGAFRNREGIGLGLAISRRIIDLHGGRMWVTSIKGEGSTFYLSLPLQPVPTAQTARAAVITSKSTMRLGSCKPAAPW
jgi:signal transduction histidine kinase